MSNERERMMDEFLVWVLSITELESRISGQLRVEFFQILEDDVIVRNCFDSWQHGSLSTFEQMLMGCIIQLVKEKNHYRRVTDAFLPPIQEDLIDEPIIIPEVKDE